MKVSVTNDQHSTPRGVDLSVVPENPTIATFGAAILTGSITAGGEMKAALLIPYAQIPNVMPVFEFQGGVVFEITVRRVTRDELPKGGWNR